MLVATILNNKGSTVATILGTATLSDATAELRLRGVGALVVSADGRTIDGIVSERDVVLCLAERGDRALGEAVNSLMSTEVRTCSPNDTCDDLMRTMTDHRVRHLPVLVNNELCGLVSIGDIVKARVEELEVEARTLHDYITTGR